MACMKVVKRVDPKSSQHKEKKYFSVFAFSFYCSCMRWWMLTKLIVVIDQGNIDTLSLGDKLVGYFYVLLCLYF